MKSNSTSSIKLQMTEERMLEHQTDGLLNSKPHQCIINCNQELHSPICKLLNSTSSITFFLVQNAPCLVLFSPIWCQAGLQIPRMQHALRASSGFQQKQPPAAVLFPHMHNKVSNSFVSEVFFPCKNMWDLKASRHFP